METRLPKNANYLALVIDDEPAVRNHIRVILEQFMNISVIEAETSEDALELVRQHKFDLVTSDLTRAGMRGFEFVTVMKQSSPNIPVIIISSVLHLPGYRERALSLGAAGCLEKPFTVAQFEALVWGVLGVERATGWRDPWA